MTSQLLRERSLLLSDRLVSMLPTPLRDPLQRAAEATGGGLLLDHPPASTRQAPQAVHDLRVSLGLAFTLALR
ncbi:hypothetical protein WME95_11815 [Sorangium sp. So ce327]|uniref:hypothetical protein n=1 Tax=Sorangium sp. So ce327 TaxID=3133301 RepID=UPI003F60BCC1